MRIAYASDLHLEKDDCLPTGGLSDVDVLILAGDLDTSPAYYPFMIQEIRKAYRGYILVIAGNHEYYGVPFPDGWQRYAESIAKDKKVFFLEKSSVEIQGVRFLGTTLWTDFAGGLQIKHHALMAGDCMAMHKADNTDVKAEEIITEHRRCLKWLESQFVGHRHEKTVIITHHAPSFMSQHPKHAGSLIGGVFCSNLEEQIERWSPAFWVHGHLHDKARYRLGSTEVLCNPWGYPDENNMRDYAFFNIHKK